jgi:hypothetical protein
LYCASDCPKTVRTFLSESLADRLRNLTTAAKDFGSRRDALTFVSDEDCPDRLSPIPIIFQAQLFYRERQPAQINVHQQSDLPARELQNCTFLVGENDRADTADDRKPRSGGAIDALYV